MSFFTRKALFSRVYEDETLTEAWHRVRQGSQVPGVDGVSVPQFQRRLFSQLKSLQHDLQTGRFQPSPVKRFTIAKPGGGRRKLGMLTVRDRLAQAAVLQVIEPLFEAEFEATSYAYRPNRNTQMAVEHIRRLVNSGRDWIVDLDIRAYFDNIPLNPLCHRTFKRVRDRRLRALIHQWLQLQALRTESARRLRKAQPFGLLQGGLLSPLLANVYLDPFDKALAMHKIKAVRYADDVLLLCGSRKRAQASLDTARKLLSKLQLEVNPDKTQICKAHDEFTFLGESLGHPATEPDATASDRPVADRVFLEEDAVMESDDLEATPVQ